MKNIDISKYFKPVLIFFLAVLLLVVVARVYWFPTTSTHTLPAESPPPCPPQCGHPYYHTVKRATSSDAEKNWKTDTSFSKAHASVPAIIQKSDGSFILYYVDGTTDTMACDISTDGKTFTNGNCIISKFKGFKVHDPYVIEVSGGHRMFYKSDPKKPPAPGQNFEIHSAASKDGINWIQDAGIRFAYPGILDPVVIKMGKIWRMYTWYEEPKTKKVWVVVADSKDGMNFVKAKIFDLAGVSPEVVDLGSGKYGFYYCEAGISFAFSYDETYGISWIDDKQPPLIKQGCDPSIIETQKGDWLMYYKDQSALP